MKTQGDAISEYTLYFKKASSSKPQSKYCTKIETSCKLILSLRAESESYVGVKIRWIRFLVCTCLAFDVID